MEGQKRLQLTDNETIRAAAAAVLLPASSLLHQLSQSVFHPLDCFRAEAKTNQSYIGATSRTTPTSPCPPETGVVDAAHQHILALTECFPKAQLVYAPRLQVCIVLSSTAYFCLKLIIHQPCPRLHGPTIPLSPPFKAT